MTIHVHEHCLKMATQEDGTPWFTAFPEPTSVCDRIDRTEVLELLEGQSANKLRDLLLVDARRTDCVGGTITSSINLPAHSFYPTRKMVYDLCKQAGIKRIIFYCGSSNGRGPRCAAWMQDYINEVGGDLQSQVMAGGIRGWVKAYGGRMMDAYDEKAWESR
ncbi:Rhodanese-like domain-containing protein [Diplogelasinospora grovesii]|uniref:Rhodanese-like domain-containing protein n=1 Tax=Diplogelasinospora grovesii TaxID=303347 RepID=A0AAN6N2Q7_9PEZI|nr:Rhodanese-like domain-containing protein [Diplogelasinospora grovesii]